MFPQNNLGGSNGALREQATTGEKLISAWNQDPREDAETTGIADDPLIGAATEPSKRPRTRLADKEVDAMRTLLAQGVNVKEVARQFGVHRGTVRAKTR